MPAKAETLLAIGESKYLSAGVYAEAVKGAHRLSENNPGTGTRSGGRWGHD